MRYPLSMLVLAIFPLMGVCSNQVTEEPTPASFSSAFINPVTAQHDQASSELTPGDFSHLPKAKQFIDRMVEQHNFDPMALQQLLAQAQHLDWIIRLMDAQAPSTSAPSGPTGAWNRYKAKFITPDNIQKGVEFWQTYAEDLKRAEQLYGVPAEIIVGIIGVETRWGRVMGSTRTLDALATLAFNYPRRSQFFTNELASFLIMSRDEGIDPTTPTGSYAGAMGYGQFMPSSFQQYAVDFNGDGRVNLWDPVDAIGSVANYFKAHGWRQGEPIAILAKGKAQGYEHGFHTKYAINTLSKLNLAPTTSLSGQESVSLLRLDIGDSYQYWLGLPNFYTITRYNHSTHYAMAVWKLGEAVKAAR